MNTGRVDRISKLFARRRSRRHARAQDVTAAEQPDRAPELLFVQSFRAGAIASKEGAEGRYTLALEGGTGQTVYLSDRPDRVVGAAPTQQVLDRLGFPTDNPPNAALVFETTPGDIDIAVVELFAPVVDAATGGITYEVAPLANWQGELGTDLKESPADLAAVDPSFGAAHLFIDGLVDSSGFERGCIQWAGGDPIVGCFRAGYNDPGQFNDVDYCWTKQGRCAPCEPGGSDLPAITRYWADKCNQAFAGCGGECLPYNRCPRGLMKSECWRGGM